MKPVTVSKSLRTIAALLSIVTCVTAAVSQPATPATPAVPTPAAAVPVDPSALPPGATPPGAADPGVADDGGMSLEAVRQAIARQDYPAAQAALDSARQASPNHPGIPLYESLIRRGQEQGPVLNSPSAGNAPAATPDANLSATPAPAVDSSAAAGTDPEPTDSSPASSTGGMMDQAKGLWENEMVRYGVLAAIALILVLIIFSFLKKRRNQPDASPYDEDYERSASTGVMSMGGLDDHLEEQDQPGDFNAFNPSHGLSDDALSSPSEPMDLTAPDHSSGASGGGAGADPSGSDLSGGLAGFTAFDHEEDEEDAPPPPRPAPVKPVDDDAMIDIFADDEPAPAPTPSAPKTPTPPADSLSVDSSGVDSKPSSQPALTPSSDEETVILSAPDEEPLRPVAPSRNATPTSTPSLSAGTVDLEDIFGSQPLPGQTPTPTSTASESLRPASPDADLTDSPAPASASAPKSHLAEEDPNSLTLPTFVSSPGAGNLEENMETPPPGNQRPKPDEGSDTQSISFEELFGSPDESSITAPVAPESELPALAPEPEPESPPAQPASEDSVEDALAAALSAMAAESPDAAPAEAAPNDEAPALSTESLDDRTERMFGDQMEKARRAVAEKNWRQAVHVLSIASALHPENEEAKQMLKDARAEKRKSEESV